MVTDRAKIQGYFAEAEETAIRQYADKHRLTASKALEALVKKGLSEGGETPEVLTYTTVLEERVHRLEKTTDEAVTLMFRSSEKAEKLEYQICCLQEEFDRYKQQIKQTYPIEYSDDRVAAITGQRVQTVWEWRHGLRKPRGERILKALEGIKLEDGRWCKRG
jgi:hypothetical protein